MKWLAALLTPTLLFASPSTLSSDRASYDGDNLILTGSVELKHSLGLMHSGFAKIEKEGREGPFLSIHLEQDVSIDLEDRGIISCAVADFDFTSLTAHLLPKEGEKIALSDIGIDSLSLTSKRAEVELSREIGKLSVSKIEAIEEVKLKHKGGFELEAEKATCFRDESSEADEKIFLTRPSGTFSNDSPLHFSSDEMVYSDSTNLITLNGNIHLSEGEFGDLFCDDTIEIQRLENEVSTVAAKGNIELKYAFENGPMHTLVSHGTMLLDRELLKLTIDSPNERPIEYFHDTFELLADKAVITYSEMEGKVYPSTLKLQGDILLTSSDKERAHLCAYADTFDYVPEEKKIILTNKSADNVLFWDGEKELTISASEIHVSQTESGPSVKGIGSVRFTFTSAENELLQTLFPFYDPTKGTK